MRSSPQREDSPLRWLFSIISLVYRNQFQPIQLPFIWEQRHSRLGRISAFQPIQILTGSLARLMKNTQVRVNCARFERSFAREGKERERKKTSGFTANHRFLFPTVVEKQVLRRFDRGSFVPRIARAPYFSPALRLWLYFLEIVTRETKRDVRRERGGEKSHKGTL